MAASSSAAAAAAGGSSSSANKAPCGHQFHWPCINNRKYGIPGGASPSTTVSAKCSGRCGKDNSGSVLRVDGHSVCAGCVVQRIRYGHPGDICPVCRAAFAWAHGPRGVSFVAARPCWPIGSSVGLSYVAHIAKWLGGHTSLTLIHRSLRDGSAYDDMLRCVGDKRGLVFIIRKDQCVFGAFITAGIRLPDDPTDTKWYKYGCDVWWFSLAGHFEQPTKIDIPGREQYVAVAGREGSVYGAYVFIGGGLYLGDGRGSDRPAADIRSCAQLTHSRDVPAGYVGASNSYQDSYGSAMLGGSYEFLAFEIEVLHVGGQ
ncbi:unnamed protein product [Vitrella brassicaformis CCMP3155]|uniref:TLDc domain-containing protein n=2 Tax=Vitrella brassicaformis TaxID=1169539 RepID=A0A0G4EUB0_VITBC|nr:unnamed protein product [Vitrella brassicaformis CCMP3155]|eukprot:CEM02012.1 unnamed protein product [Vitrella brassicaformis CCMP3155]